MAFQSGGKPGSLNQLKKGGLLSGGWWLRNWDRISTSFWALPGLLTVSAIVLALGLMTLEAIGLLPVGWLMQSSPAEAREILTTVAAAAISIAGVTFSIVMVVLTLASSQFGSRLVRSFIHDRANQFVLGVFVATFAYCVILLGTVGTYTENFTLVPKAALAGAIVLALVDIGVFIYFIHHLAVGIQSPQVIRRVGDELDSAIDQCFNQDDSESPDTPDGESLVLRSEHNGYVSAIDVNYLVESCEELEVKAECLVEVGEFVLYSAPLIRLWSDTEDDAAERCLDDGDSREKLMSGVLLASQRSPVQDVTFAMTQLVEISVRSLSPGINDPFTAMNAANRMAAALIRISRYPNQQTVFGDEQPTVWLKCRSKADYVDTVFAALSEYAGDSTLVNQHLLSLCDRLLSRIDDVSMQQRLGKYATLMIDNIDQSGLAKPERFDELCERINEKISRGSATSDESADTGTTGD